MLQAAFTPKTNFDADSVDAAIPRPKASLFVCTLVAHESRHHDSVLSFLPQLRDKRRRDAFRQQRLERGEFGALPLQFKQLVCLAPAPEKRPNSPA